MKLALILLGSLSVYAGTKIPMVKTDDYSLIQKEYSQVITLHKHITLTECSLLMKQIENSKCVKTYQPNQNKR